MDARTFLGVAITPAFRLLDSRMNGMAGDEAHAMVLAICLQESGLQHRRQLEDGPARGFSQSEFVGTHEVLNHPASGALAGLFLAAMVYRGYSAEQIHAAREFDAVLDMGLARLALWRDPAPLPRRTAPTEAWLYYLRVWAPGAPRPAEWRGNWDRAWAALG